MKNKKFLYLLGVVPMVFGVAACSNDSPSPNNQRKFHDEAEVNTLFDVIVKGEKAGHFCPSKGNTRALIVPVEFSDYPADEIGKYYNSETSGKKAKKHTGDEVGTGRSREDTKEDIRKCYFGKPEETYWHSLSSYYKEASYGKQNFNGLVANWFKAYTNFETMEWCTAKQWADGTSAAATASTILSYYTNERLKKYHEFLKEDGSYMFNSGTEFLQYFDSDKDGVIDIIEMVYSAPFYATYTNEKGEDVPIDNEKFWAYCGGVSNNGNKQKPELGKWAWQSYYTMVEGGVYENGKHRAWTCKEISDGVAKVDAHTIIHETGHGMGLPDYYDYDYKTSPAHSVDMMDHNVGDHNSYSKSLYGWVDPIVVTGPTQVTVRSFTDTGDCIMIPYRGYFEDNPKYGNTFNTEYIAVELYTPTGVNEFDSKQKYAGAYPLCPQKPGLKVWHVDSRLGLFNWTGGSKLDFVSYTDQIVSTAQSSYVQVAASNTGSRTVNGFNLINFMNSNQGSQKQIIDDETLWHAGDILNDTDNYRDFTMNSGKAWGYKMVIESLSADSATITFYKA